MMMGMVMIVFVRPRIRRYGARGNVARRRPPQQLVGHLAVVIVSIIIVILLVTTAIPNMTIVVVMITVMIVILMTTTTTPLVLLHLGHALLAPLLERIVRYVVVVVVQPRRRRRQRTAQPAEHHRIVCVPHAPYATVQIPLVGLLVPFVQSVLLLPLARRIGPVVRRTVVLVVVGRFRRVVLVVISIVSVVFAIGVGGVVESLLDDGAEEFRGADEGVAQLVVGVVVVVVGAEG
mmetsp:Transcript_37513/g.69412  ORF Transcript_37513/g.69412 Transcript_37513/m.69412 type:complete len:234 (-) Transcript_37513:81-782(-)